MKRQLLTRLLKSFLPIVMLLGGIFLLLIFVEFQAGLDANKIETIHITKQLVQPQENPQGYDYEIEIIDHSENPLYQKAKLAFETAHYQKAERYYDMLIAQGPSAELYNLLGLSLAKQGAFRKALAAYHASLSYDRKYYRAYYNRAYLYSLKENYAKAILDYKKSILYQPFHFKSYYNLGLAQYKSKMYKQATQSFDKAQSLSSGERKSKALYQKALCYLQYKHPKKDKAKYTLTKAIRIKPDALLPRLLLIKLEADKSKQIAQLKELISLHPSSVLPVASLAKLYKASGSWNKGNELYKKYLKQNSKEAKALRYYAKFLYDHGQLPKALNYLRDAHEIDPKNLEVQLLLAKIYHKSGNDSQAIAYYTSALKEQKNLSEIYLDLSFSYKNIQDKKSQKSALKKSLLQNKKNSQTLLELGKLAYFDKNYPLAKKYLVQSIKTDDQAYQAWYQLGQVYTRQDKDKRAGEAYLEAIKINPNHIRSQKALARYYYTVNDFHKSIQLYEKILLETPKDIELLEYLSRSFYRLKIYDKAEKAISTALSIAPEDLALNKQLAKIYLKTHRAKEASEIFSQLIDQNPSNVLMHYNFAKALKKNEEYERALHAINKTLALKPTHARALALKQKIQIKLKEKK